MPDSLFALSLLRGATAALGAVIVSLAVKAYLHAPRRTLLYFTGGVAVVTTGFAIEGFAYELLGMPLATATAIEAAFTLVAFGLLVFSLFAKESATLPRSAG